MRNSLSPFSMPTLSQPHITGLLGIVALGVWLHLFFGRGWFWRVKKWDTDTQQPQPLNSWPSVVAIIPARNEASSIAPVMASLAQQDYPGAFSIVFVDDHSEDSTAEIAKRAADELGASHRIQIISAFPLAAGWTGKLWALNEGLTHPAKGLPAYYWFTDADITHAPDTLRRLVVCAESDRLDLVSLMVLLQSKTLPERALIPAFLYFFLMLYPPQWIADDELRTAGAAGGCILFKREALERIGGIAAIRGEVIDDCALAKKVKESGGHLWMGLTRASTSVRAYESFAEIRDLIARTAFTQLRYSVFILSGTLAGMLLTYAAPIALLFTHDPIARVLGLSAWLLMTLSFLPTVRFYRLSPLGAPFLPLAALFYTYATLLSALRYWLGRGAQWKGRTQARRPG